MNEKTKEFFHRMYDEAFAYGKAAAEREKEKEALMAADDWDAVKEWHEREAQFKNPFTSGQYKAYWAYRNSSQMGLGELEMNDHLWENEVKDFSETLIAAGITTFVLTCQSTGLMENIHQLEDAGWRLAGTCRLAVKENRYGEDRIEQHLGLRFEIRDPA